MSEITRITFQAPAERPVGEANEKIFAHTNDEEANFGVPIKESKTVASAHTSIHETDIRKKQVHKKEEEMW
jgi:hypothetical protein